MNRLLPFLLIVMLWGCTKNEVRLAFELPADVNEPCRIVYYASGSNVGMIRETVAQVTAGKGEEVLPLHYPSLIYLFSPAQKMPGALIYGIRGDKFRISGKNGNVSEWEISGNAVTEELSKWRLENASLIRTRDNTPEKLNEAVAKYVDSHPDYPSAAVILYYYFTRRGYEKEFYALQAKLDRSIFEDEELMSALSMADLISQLPDKVTIPDEIVLTAESGYGDTVFLSKGSGAMLMFRGANDSGVSEDSVEALLKRLRNRNVESKRPVVAELYMDIDSFSWRRYLKKDTVAGMKRLWMPLGTTDSIALRMGVRYVPMYVVIGLKGKELYRGSDWQKAVRKFESISP